MISIITAVYNQLDMNRLYYESLCRTTDNQFELIIIDNGSTDGTLEYFRSLGDRVKVIANDGNYSYPYCQNQGIAAARYDVLAFFNNDIITSPHWDSRLLQVLGKDGYEILSLASNDRMADSASTHRLSRRWKRIKYPVIYALGQRSLALRLMTYLCYGNWERFCERTWSRWKTDLRIGFSGSAIVMTRKGLEAMNGEWDPGQQAADFDLFFRTVERNRTHGDIKPMHIVSGIFHHHFRRLTLRCSYPPFKDRDRMSTLDRKWSPGMVEQYTAMLK